MKALLSAFALMAFVAASTVPYQAHAQDQTQQTTPKKTHKAKAKKVHKTAKAKKTKKKMAAPASG